MTLLKQPIVAMGIINIATYVTLLCKAKKLLANYIYIYIYTHTHYSYYIVYCSHATVTITIAHFILRKWSCKHSSCKQSKERNIKGNIDDKNWLAKCSPLVMPHLPNNRGLQQFSSFMLNL